MVNSIRKHCRKILKGDKGKALLHLVFGAEKKAAAEEKLEWNPICTGIKE